MFGTRSSFLVLSSCLLACGGGESSSPPVTPTSKSTAPADAPPPTASATAASTSEPAPAPGGGAWPFGPAPTAEEKTAQLERLKKDPGPIKSNWTPPGKGDRYGHAEGVVNAPVDAVRTKLLDFNHYKELAGPKFKTVRVVDKQGANTDVYFQLPIMKGIVMIQYTTRFAPARPASGGDVIEGTFVKGNIKGMHIAFTLRPGADDKSSVVVCDLLLQLNVPAPQSAVDEELRDACGDAINSLRKQVPAP